VCLNHTTKQGGARLGYLCTNEEKRFELGFFSGKENQAITPNYKVLDEILINILNNELSTLIFLLTSTHP